MFIIKNCQVIFVEEIEGLIIFNGDARPIIFVTVEYGTVAWVNNEIWMRECHNCADGVHLIRRFNCI
jgi:hypothetical protein